MGFYRRVPGEPYVAEMVGDDRSVDSAVRRLHYNHFDIMFSSIESECEYPRILVLCDDALYNASNAQTAALAAKRLFDFVNGLLLFDNWRLTPIRCGRLFRPGMRERWKPVS